MFGISRSLRTQSVVAKETLSVGAVSTPLALASAQYYDFCEIEIDDNPVRFWLDGTDPTGSVGHLCDPGSQHIISPNEAQGLRAIRTTSVNGTIRAVYYVKG